MAHIAVLFAIRLLRRTVEYDSSPHCSNTHAAYHLCGLATKTGEKFGLASVCAWRITGQSHYWFVGPHDFPANTPLGDNVFLLIADS